MSTATLDAKAEYVVALEEDWQDWLPAIFPNLYSQYPFADHEAEFWDAVWDIPVDGVCDAPIYIVGRGGGKSTVAETACVMLGARRLRKCIMYISGTKEQTTKHAKAIEAQLVSAGITEFYPGLSERKLSKYGHSQGWNGQVIATNWGLVIFFVSLDTESRGARWEESRVDMFVLDDIDSRHDSRATTKKKQQIITESLLPAGSHNAVTIFCQNLITKDSIASQLVDGRAQFLARRKVIGPVPLMRGLTYEKRKGKPGYDILTGEPTVPRHSVTAIQKMMDDWGLEAFLRESQNEVATTPEGALFAEFDEFRHVITREEFAEGYGQLCRQPKIARDANGKFRIPIQGHLGRYQDWGATVGHPCVTGWFWRPHTLQPLNDALFSYRERCWPAYPDHEIPLIPVSPGRVADDINKIEIPWSERARIIEFKMSHEASATANAYSQDQDPGEELNATKIKADRKDGIPQAQNLLAIDWSKPHPFRKYPAGHPRAGEPLMGCPRFFIIVADGQGELYMDDEGQMRVVGAIDADGFARARYEVPKYCNRFDSSGVEIDSPDNKIDDDWIDMFKMAVRYFGLAVQKLSEGERIEQALHPGHRLEAFQQPGLSDQDRTELYLARQWELDRIRNQRRKATEVPPYLRPNMTSNNKFLRGK
jgi:hypothetical protein